jgi:hypothetical protein
MNQAITQVTVSSRTIEVQHIKISSERSFAEVHQRFENMLPRRDANLVAVLRNGDQKSAEDCEKNGPKLLIEGERDHGVLLQIAGGKRNAVQYDVGNP